MEPKCYFGLYRTPDHGRTHHDKQCCATASWLAFFGAWNLTTLWCDEHKPAHTEGVILAKIEVEAEKQSHTVWGLLYTGENRQRETQQAIAEQETEEHDVCHSAHPDGSGGICVSPLVGGECENCGFQVGDDNPYA